MGRSLAEVVADLPPERRVRVDSRYRELKEEVEGLRELRQAAGKAQADVASALNIKQPSVSKIESQADMYLSTLRKYIRAIGGELELVVRLPSRRTIRLQHLTDAATPHADSAGPTKVTRKSPSKTAGKRVAPTG